VTLRVIFEPEAQADLDELFAWIADRADVPTAERYMLRVRRPCERLDIFPERGTRRDDIAPGLRLFGIERRVTVAFKVYDDHVSIVRVLYGGRDVEAILRESDSSD
jgi:toxin ParE1/3/4